jgi:hypothetical protein
MFIRVSKNYICKLLFALYNVTSGAPALGTTAAVYWSECQKRVRTS